MALVQTIVASGDLVDPSADDWRPFAGDDLLAACRPRGLPLGNLTSQFWSNCMLHALDLLMVSELRCPAYVRYVDDFALFGDHKRQLWACKEAVQERLAQLRLRLHEASTQVAPTAAGTPWLGFVVYPTHVKLKSRQVRHDTRRLGVMYAAWREGSISFGEFDTAVQGWINHVRQADSWGAAPACAGAVRAGSRVRTALPGVAHGVATDKVVMARRFGAAARRTMVSGSAVQRPAGRQAAVRWGTHNRPESR